MGRRKVTHELISEKSTRRVTFRKRKEGILKKINELTILCGLRACAIIYSDYKDGPEVWPNRREVRVLLNRFSALPKEKQTKYMMDQKDLMTRMIQDAEKKLEKEQMHSRAMELGMIAAFSDLDDADYSEDLIKAADVVEKRINVIRQRIEALESRTALVKKD